MAFVEFSDLPEYARNSNPDLRCVRPVNVPPPPSMELPMCGNPAAYVSVRRDGWVSGTVWCNSCIAQDNARTEKPMDYGNWEWLEIAR